jgi:hypothetical protein
MATAAVASRKAGEAAPAQSLPLLAIEKYCSNSLLQNAYKNPLSLWFLVRTTPHYHKKAT